MRRRRRSCVPRLTSSCSCTTTRVGSRCRRDGSPPSMPSIPAPARSERFTGKLFVDCTGHGTIGILAGADHEMEPKGRMGMSNMWRWEEAGAPQSFPETPWALQLEMADFPYPRDFHGQWFWESGFDKDPLGDAEGIRDWNLRAVYGAFNAMKNGDGAEKHPNAAPDLDRLHRRAARISPADGRRDAQPGRHRGEEGFRRRLRAEHLVDRPALPEEAVRQALPGEPVHLGTLCTIAGWTGSTATRCRTAASTRATCRTCSWPGAASASPTRLWGRCA